MVRLPRNRYAWVDELAIRKAAAALIEPSGEQPLLPSTFGIWSPIDGKPAEIQQNADPRPSDFKGTYSEWVVRLVESYGSAAVRAGRLLKA